MVTLGSQVYKNRALGPKEGYPWSYSLTPGGSSTSGIRMVLNDWQAIKTYNNSPAHRYIGRASWARDIGGSFLSHKTYVTGEPQFYKLYRKVAGNPPLEERWQGHLVAHQDLTGVLNRIPNANPTLDKNWLQSNVPSGISDTNLNAYGSTAIARCSPTNPLVDLSVTLAELRREGLPHLPSQTGGNLGSEYLNYQFGIAPVISDGRDLITAIREGDELIAQYQRDSGRLIRRAYQFEPTITSNVTTQTLRVPVPLGGTPSGGLIEPGKVTIVDTLQTFIWFSGAFTYYLSDEAAFRQVAILDKRYGIVPGVDSVWNTTPWSWLVDWYTNAGDVMHNINAFTADGLVMPYGYIMATQRRTREYVWQGRVKIDNSWVATTVSQRRIDEIKQRKPAHPFGFGITDADLSARQKLILAALGYSRLL